MEDHYVQVKIIAVINESTFIYPYDILLQDCLLSWVKSHKIQEDKPLGHSLEEHEKRIQK